MTRVLLVTNDFPPRAGGIQSYLQNLVDLLPSDDIVVYASRWKGHLEFDAQQPYRVYRHGTTLMLPTPFVARRAADIIRREDIETVWFGVNTQSAFATGQARGAALVACAEHDLDVGEFSPSQIKLAVVGEGTAEKDQVQYMVKQILGLDDVPHPDHAADALAAAICYVTHGPRAQRT